MTESDAGGLLSPYRVLDLCGEAGALCGRIFADLGADVVRIEPPEGCPSRHRGPFLDDDPSPEKGLYWLAYSAGKRSVALDLSDASDRRSFETLVAGADFLIESFAPGTLDALGLGYASLARLNPALIHVSITPYGQTGPYKDHKGPDIVTWATSGFMSICGSQGEPPYHLSDSAQSFMLGSGDAAVGAMIAHEQRLVTGRGQHVDVAYRESVTRSALQVTSTWAALGRNLKAGERPGANLPWTWACKDGEVVVVYFSGPGAERRNGGLFKLMESLGFDAAPLRAIEWDKLIPHQAPTGSIDQIMDLTTRFFSQHPKIELYNRAIELGVSLVPVATSEDILSDPQLEARSFWQDIEYRELGRTLRHPGPFAAGTGAPPRLRGRAPHLGEHTAEVLAEPRRTPASLPAEPRRQASDKPLAGLRVADFSWFVVGPMTTKPFADYGAEVINIESGRVPDTMRITPPAYADKFGINRGGDFSELRTSNKSINLDLAKPAGKEIARQIVAKSDIVVENFSAGTMERLGFGYEELRKINPRIIMVSSAGQGQTGPHSQHRGGGGHYTALGGLNYITGDPNSTSGYMSAYTDYIGPRLNVTLILGALDHLRRTGKGQFFDVSQYEATLHFIAPTLLDYAANGRIQVRQANRQAGAAPHGAYRCSGSSGEDRWCTIAVRDDQEWHAFKRALGSPAWAEDARFATLPDRKANEDELDHLISSWTATRPPTDVMNLLQNAGVAAGEVLRGQELLEEDPQLRHRHFFHEVEHPEIGTYRPPAHAYHLPDAPLEMTPAPTLGQHTAYVLQEILGLSDADVTQLAIDEVIE